MRRSHPPRVGYELGQPLDANLRQLHQDQRPAVVLGGGEEDPWLAQEQGLLLGLVADVEHGDVGTDESRLTGSALRIGPDEPLVPHPEVEAVTVDLLDVGQRQRQAAYVFGVSHRGSLLDRAIALATGYASAEDGATAMRREPLSQTIFPTEGCWQVTGRVGQIALTFVTFVIKGHS